MKIGVYHVRSYLFRQTVIAMYRARMLGIEPSVVPIYVGRAMPSWRGGTEWDRILREGSPLANPHRIGPKCNRDEAVARYRKAFPSLIRNDAGAHAAMKYLQAVLRDGKEVMLGCWCKCYTCESGTIGNQPCPTCHGSYNAVCHGDVIKEYLELNII